MVNWYHVVSKGSVRVFLLGMVLLFQVGWFVAACAKQNEQPQKSPEKSALSQSPLVQTVEPPKGQVDLRTAIVRVADQNIPAVVHIEVTQRQEVTNPFIPFENDPFFRYFFNFPDQPRKFERELKGLGTGMIIDAEGHILTNNHVVGGATEIRVLLSDGKQYSAKVVGTDPKTDLAVIKIEATETLPHVVFGDSDKVQVGEWVVAIGHPRGLDQTVTQGIISAKHRQGIIDPSTYQDFLQTDAAINPGNSGGPLLDLQGEVIGVNAAIVSVSGGYEGIGFAIPSNMALYIAKALMAHGKVERGWLGVSVQDLTPDLAQSFGLESPKGALIADVTKDGPAEKAGMKRGDVVLSYKGKEMRDSSALRNEVANTPSGEEVKVTIWRDGKQEEMKVKLEGLEDATKMLSASLKDRLGGEFQPVTSKEVEKYRLESQQGVVIVRLDPQGALAKAGFEVGDIIFAINGKAIESVESLIDLMNAVPPNQRITLLVLDHRSGNTGYVRVLVR